MNIGKLTVWSVCGLLAGAASATNYSATWNSGDPISIGGTTYRDFFDTKVWGGKDPTTTTTGDNLIMSGNGNVSFSKSGTALGTMCEGSSGAQRKIHLNGFDYCGNWWRVYAQRVSIDVTGAGSLTLKTGLKWPDRGWQNTTANVMSNNTFTVHGEGTSVDFGSLYFGHNQATGQEGAGADNKVIVKDGAFAAATVYLGHYANAEGRPNGLYVSGEGTVFSNKKENAYLDVRSSTGSGSFSNEFVVADGATVQNLANFNIGYGDNTNAGVGHLIAFRGSNTRHDFTGNNSILGLTHRLEIDGATVSHKGMQQHGYVTVKNGGRLNANMPIYSDSRTLITGEASVYSNINVGAYGLISFQRDATVSNIVFEIADGAKFENLGRMDISGAGGNKVVFRGTKTDLTARHGTETSGFSVVEVGNALEVVDGAKLRLTTGSGAAHGNCRIRLYGDLLVSGENGLLSFNTTTAMMVGALRSPTSRITVADGAKFEVGGGLNLGADGGTNACLSVTNGGVVTAAGVYLGYASNDPKYEQAPHDCVIDVAGSGSKLTCSGLTVGTGEKASADATGCCTNGYGNVLRVRDGAQVVNSVDLTIGNTCSSNALEVLSGGRIGACNVYIGRAESAVIGPTKAQFCAIGNRCVVAGGGAVEATGLLSIRGNDSSCFMTNGVLHTTMTNNFECMANTGHLVIAGTNSLLKGDLATRIIAVNGRVDFVLPVAGYVRAPIQSDNLVQFGSTVNFAFLPPAEAGNPTSTYTLAEVPASGKMDINEAMKNKFRTALSALQEADPRFSEYRVKVVVEEGFKRLQLKPRGGLMLIVR